MVPALTQDAIKALTYRYAFLVGLLEFAIAVPMPVLVLHMTGRGLDLAVIGLAFTLRAVLVVLLELPTGGLADAIGRRPVALASQLFTMASFIALLFVTGPALALLYALLQGIGAALHSGALDAWYVDELKRLEEEVELEPHLATVNVFQAVGMLLGTALGGALPSLTAGLDLPWPASGFGVALLAGIALRALVWLLTLVLMHEPIKPEGGSVVGWRAVPEILMDAGKLTRSIPSIRWLLLAAGASGLAMVSIETFWQPIAAFTFGDDPSRSVPFAVLGTLSGVAVLAGSLAVMRWGKLFPGGSVALAGASTVIRGLAMYLFASMASSWGLGLGLALTYFALSTTNVPHYALLHDVIPSSRRSSMLSVHSLVFFGGIAIASGPLGWLATQLGPRLALSIAAALTIMSAFAYVRVARVHPRSRRKSTLVEGQEVAALAAMTSPVGGPEGAFEAGAREQLLE
ncbi:MAG TPA: MFS transporter [Trueperaceae bacterium]|jgi:MFS family permease|nr:MFS transporter [Trueperaceae bacterium]